MNAVQIISKRLSGERCSKRKHQELRLRQMPCKQAQRAKLFFGPTIQAWKEGSAGTFAG